MDDKYEFTWTVDDWDHLIDNGSGSYTTSTKEFFRELIYGVGFEDDYVEVEVEDANSSLIRAQPIRISANDKIKITFKQLWGELKSGIVGNSEVCMYARLKTDGNAYYSLTPAGEWVSTIETAGFTVTRIVTNKDDVEYQEVTLSTNGVPADGEFTFGLYLFFPAGLFWKRFKDLTFEVTPPLNQLRTKIVKGDYHKYTIGKNVNKYSESEIFIDDGYENHKGTIYLADGETLTSVLWNPRDYPSGPYPFKRHHALAKWFYNRRYRNIIEGNFFGLEWDKDGTRYPIGLMNTIRFAEDSDKTYAILNMREMDFMNNTWNADLVEIWDEDVDNVS